ncbi:hypothetical protein [Erythrobacter sp. AP23]|uniref:hypothetical protein n=1 Tax=Erythrobacter sp. AP23 TaxID=499656 RepID=UPI00076CB27C|nr:hypothetical protein [Erythrobacter sp. AP23]KWV96128.1 hypothetical protein ASS64_02635 [Erythrobacter sp. AP23]
MYATWPCPLPDGTAGEEMVLGFDRARQQRVLVIPPLFDEANKFRHQIVEIMRRVDAQDIDCFLPDLPGCNESIAPLPAQTIAGWRAATAAAATHFAATHVFAVRSGGWLVPDTLPGWVYAPVKARQVLRGMLRARSLAAREAGVSESSEDLLAEGREKGLTLAGWDLGAPLIRELDEGEFAASPAAIPIEQGEVGGKPLWLRAENDDDPAQADALAAILIAGLGVE